MARQRLSLARSRFGETNLAVASALGQLGLAAHYNATEDSETLLRRALAIKRLLLGNEDPEVARSILALAFDLMIRKQFAEAENLAREALGILRKARGAEGLDVAETLSTLGITLSEAGKQAEAEPLLLQAFMIQTNLLGTEDPRVLSSLHRLSKVFLRQGKFPEAEATCRQALTLARKVLGQEHREVAVMLNFLGVVLINAGRSPEAEDPLWESHMMVRKLLGIRHPDVVGSSDALVDVLMAEHKYSEIEKLFTEIMPPVGEAPPVRRGLLRMRARFFARLGRWTEALADASEFVQLPPKSLEAWLWRASLLVQTGDLESYEQHRRACVALFGTSTDPSILATLAKFALIVPASDPDLETFAKLGDAAAASETAQADFHWIQLTKGLAEYRRGHFCAAADWARRALSKAGADPLTDVQAFMVLGMAQQQLKKGAEAQDTFAKGLQLADTKLPKLENGDISDGWNDWIIAHALMREASGLVQGRGHGGKETK
jgi:tetratricopeptide (TPR) repeat protein